MKHQGESQPHSSGTGRFHRSIPQLCNGSSRFGYSADTPFASRLGGPFCVAVAGRFLTVHLLSEPPCSAYSSSSMPFGYWAVLYAGLNTCQGLRPHFLRTQALPDWRQLWAPRKNGAIQWTEFPCELPPSRHFSSQPARSLCSRHLSRSRPPRRYQLLIRCQSLQPQGRLRTQSRPRSPLTHLPQP